MSTVKLQGNDGKEPFVVSFKAACCSGTLKTMLTDLGYAEDEVNDPILLSNVNDAILRKVMEWAEHHKDDPEEAVDDNDRQVRHEDISDWDAKYFQVDQDTLWELILAANYLDMRRFLNLACKTTANTIKGKSADEIRMQFNLRNDFTREEEEEVRFQNNEWMQDSEDSEDE